MLWKYLKNLMLKHPDQLVCEDIAEINYEELIAFAEEYGKNLRGIKCCAILCSSEMAASMAILSCFAAGVTALPLSYRYGTLHCKKILESVSPDAIIMDRDGELQIIHISDANYKSPKEHPALIMCTSGTTGKPKGAMLTEKNIVTNITDIAAYFDIDAEDSILIARPLYHCAVMTGELLTALIKGVKIRFYSGVFNPGVVLALIKTYNITVFCGTPTLLSMMSYLKRGEYPLQHICVSGECMDMKTGKNIRSTFPDAEIYHVYGLTEACPRVSYLPPNIFDKYADCVGIPLDSVSVKILCEDGRVARLEEVGLLWIKGDNIMSGYYNAPEKTSEVMKDGWLCTGDLAQINEVGLLKIKGRVDDLIIKAGMNIYPGELESALRSDPRVKETLVYSERDEKCGIRIILDISGDFANDEEVRELCQNCLPAYQMPSKINLLDELKKNGSGKVIRHK